MNKRLLILADPFTRPSYAPRLRFLCEYLEKNGWELDVYTEKFADIPFAHRYPIHEITFYSGSADWFIKAAWSLLTYWKERHFTREVRRYIKGKTYDKVFCTTFSTFPLITALTLARELNLPLHVDIRDLEEQVPGAQLLQHRGWWTKPFRAWYVRVNIHRRNRVLRQADMVTTISPWHVDFIRQLNPNVHLVYNGYDPERFFPRNLPTGRFVISYIGRLYEFRKIEPVEEAVRALHNPDIVLVKHMPDHNPLPPEQVPNAIHQSSIMLVLTSSDAKGVMTTKFYEALGCEKPVLCVPSDHGVLAQTIRDTNAGVCADTIEEMQAFILDKYAEWKQNGFTRQPVNIEAKNAFSRLEEARQMEDWLCS